MDQAEKKNILRHFTYGLYAVTVGDGQVNNAFTAKWLSQASFEPPLLMLSVENASYSIGVIQRTEVFTVNVLAETQREMAGQLGRPRVRTPDKMEAAGRV